MLTHTAISGRDGVINLPDRMIRDEYFRIDSCKECKNSNATNAAAMNFVKNEGCGFDVLFSASFALDWTIEG